MKTGYILKCLLLTALTLAVVFAQAYVPWGLAVEDSKEVKDLIKKYGSPGIVPSPEYLSLNCIPPKVADWPAKPTRSLSGSGSGLSPVLPQTKAILVILIEFTDKAHSASHNKAYYQNLIFGTSQGQMGHYYLEVSYGLLTLSGMIADPTGTPEWYVSANTKTWWGADSATGIDDANGPIFNLAKEAVTKADANINFATYDTNGDYIIEGDELSLCIVHAGNGQESSGLSTDIWSHRWAMYGVGWTWGGNPLTDVIVDGRRITNHPDDAQNGRDVGGYFMQAETSPMGTFAHEFGHDLGLPDLYDTDYTSDGVGVFCLMAFGSWGGTPSGTKPIHPSAWCKARMGWLVPTVISSPMSNVPVGQVETSSVKSVYRLSITSTEYFLIENRERVGYDASLPGSGMLVWHIDDHIGETLGTNAYEGTDRYLHRWVDLEEAHTGTQHLDVWYDGNNGDAADMYKSSTAGFSGGTVPNSRAYNGRSTSISVTRISAPSSSMTCNLYVPVPLTGEGLPFSWYTVGNTYVRSTFVADVDGDGQKEIVTGGSFEDGTRSRAEVKVCRWDGTSWINEGTPNWYTIKDTYVWSVFVRDVDGDSQNEIVTAGFFKDGTRSQAQLRVYRWTGSTMTLEGETKWYTTKDTFLRSVFADDVDGDGKTEIITGGHYYDNTRSQAQIRVFRWTGTSWINEGSTNWYTTSNTYVYSVFVEDVDGDGQKEIVTAGNYNDGTRTRAQLRVLRWTGSAFVGEGVTNWYSVGDTELKSVTVADVDGDGQKEIVTAGNYNDGTRIRAQLSVLRWTGSGWASWKTSWYTLGSTRLESVQAADVDGDGQVEIVTGGYYHDGTRNRAQLKVFRFTGSYFIAEADANWYATSHTQITAVFIADVDSDSQIEITCGGYHSDGTRWRAFVRVLHM